MMVIWTASSAAVMGVAGAGHCALMCGGIAGLASSDGPGGRHSEGRLLLRLVATSAGRVSSYAIAGALVGALGGTLDSALPVARVSWVLRIAAGLLMVGVGLGLAGATTVMRPIEWAGYAVWRRLSFLASRLLPVRSMAGAVMLGLVWGWLPCGLVYAAVALASTTGSAWEGAVTMVAFGVGTIPMLLALGRTGAFVARHARTKAVRRFAAVAMMALGLLQVTVAGRSVSSPAVPACHRSY